MSIKLNSSGGGSVTIQEPTTASAYMLTLPAQTANIITDSSEVLNIGSGQFYKDSSGNVGIGTSNPSAFGSNVNVVAAKSFVAGGASTGYGFYPYYASATNYAAILGDSTGAMTFTTGVGSPAERVRIDNIGQFIVGGTTGFGKQTIKWSSGYGLVTTPTADNLFHLVFTNAATSAVGSIGCSSSTTAYNTSSDYRLKENVQPMTDGLATVSALNPVRYDWIGDKSAGEGFIAHELAEVIPLAVTGEKDAVNEDGKPIHQGVDYSKIVVHLVAAIQELKAELDATKAEVAALKGAV